MEFGANPVCTEEERPCARELYLALAAREGCLVGFRSLVQRGAGVGLRLRGEQGTKGGGDGGEEGGDGDGNGEEGYYPCEHDVYAQIKKMMKRLVRSERLGMLSVYVEAGLYRSVHSRFGIEVALPLVRAVRAGAGVELVRRLVGAGAHPARQMVTVLKRRYLDSLGAAVLAGSEGVFEWLVVEGGADVRGKDISPPFVDLVHIPIFAATFHMAKTGSTRLVELCLDRGVDVNQWAYQLARRKNPGGTQIIPMTPLLYFIDVISVDSDWNRPMCPERTPFRSVALLLERGASAAPLLAREELDPRLNASMVNLQRDPIAVDILFRWGPYALAKPAFLQTLRLLVRAGGAGGMIDIIRLVKMAASYVQYPDSKSRGYELGGWCQLLGELSRREDARIDVMLADLATHVGMDNDCVLGAGISRATFAAATLIHLLDRGIPLGSLNSSGETALLTLCKHWSDDRSTLLVCDAFKGNTLYYVARARRCFLRYLLRHGADADLPGTELRPSAKDQAVAVIMAAIEKHSDEPRRCINLEKFLAILKGDAQDETDGVACICPWLHKPLARITLGIDRLGL